MTVIADIIVNLFSLIWLLSFDPRIRNSWTHASNQSVISSFSFEIRSIQRVYVHVNIVCSFCSISYPTLKVLLQYAAAENVLAWTHSTDRWDVCYIKKCRKKSIPRKYLATKFPSTKKNDKSLQQYFSWGIFLSVVF
jgi:hypothetical protein